MAKLPSKTVLQVTLSNGAEVTVQTSQSLTADALEELRAHLAICEWGARRQEAKNQGQALALSLMAWWREFQR